MIVDYVIGERLVGIVHPLTPMQALTMTSIVRRDRVPSPSRPRFVPQGPWGAWLAGVLGELGIATAPADAKSTLEGLGIEEIERNPALGLVRRAVTRRPAGAPLAGAIADESAPNDLVHLPCDDRMAAYPSWNEPGTCPSG